MKEEFVPRRFSAIAQNIIDDTNGIIDEYVADRFTLTIRQLYYQMISRDLFPKKWEHPLTKTKNTAQNYAKFASIISNARNAGLVDWSAIEDRGRQSVIPSHWNSPAEIVRAAANQFRVDRWEGQQNYVECMVEKDALSGILEPVCRNLDIRFSANRGYSSSTALYEAGKRMEEAVEQGRNIIILYLGDHDPSGIDMTRDIAERVSMYSNSVNLEVMRLALNMDQVRKWNPPENPAKQTDSRFKGYIVKYGKSSWELDAVEPRELARLVETTVQQLIDEETWDEIGEKESKMKSDLMQFAKSYERKNK